MGSSYEKLSKDTRIAIPIFLDGSHLKVFLSLNAIDGDSGPNGLFDFDAGR